MSLTDAAVAADLAPAGLEFSLDHTAMLNTTVWGNGTVSTIVIRPDRLTHTVD